MRSGGPLTRPALVAAIALALVLAACSSRGGEEATTRGDGLVAVAASFDVAVGPPRRFIVGLFSPEKNNIGHGTIEMRFSFLGRAKVSGTARPGPTVVGRFLALPGSAPPPPGGGPVLLRPSDGRGVYAVEVGFDEAGFWQVEVTADLRGRGTRSATAAFEVLARHLVPAPGDAAPQSDNLTVASTGVPRQAVDSRASGDEPLPDPELHQSTIAEALGDRHPVLAVFATPTFCVSRFCGPVTDMVAELARSYSDRARFVHVEIWRDFQAKQLNQAAEQWLASNGAGGNEPWVFLIGADGRVSARWDNVALREEIEPLLRALPTMASIGE